MSTMENSNCSAIASQLMAVEVIAELLASTSPQKLCESLTDHLRELTGAKTVMVLVHRLGSETDELLYVSPVRRAGLFTATGLNDFCFEKTPDELPFFPDELSVNHPLKAVLLRAGIQSMARYALRSGGELVGLLLLFDLPGVQRITETTQIITILSSPIALALKNALAYFQIEQLAQELEKRVEERTAELRQRNIQLQNSEDRFDQLARQSRTITWEVDAQGLYTYMSHVSEAVLGYHPDEIIGKKHFYDIHPAEGREEFRKAAFEVFHQKGAFRNLDNPIQTKDGGLVWVATNGLPLLGADGTLLGYRGSDIDITERKRAEEEKLKLESQLQQAQKMESVGRLAGGVAHDFNNMLSVILGHAELGLMNLDPAHPVCADLKEIRTSAERSAELTRQLLAFARKQTIAPKVIDLNETVAGMLKMLQRLIGEDIHLRWQPAPGLCQINIDPSQIDQILANLCVNARDAIEETGRITIETGICSIDADFCAANPDAAPGEYVHLLVRDDGKGMDREIQTHIFEPFYTTKELGKGTGLGLAMVYGAVRQNNGFINIQSEPGKGTTFSIYLPRHEEQNIKKQSEGVAQVIPRGQETILLVEDEPAILNMAATMLEKQGYSVLRADAPGRALELAREHHGTIHLLMTDVIMPEMNGRDLAEKILSMYPDMKRLFISGYTADVIAHHGVLDDGVHFIQKPFSLPDMVAKVREVLDA